MIEIDLPEWDKREATNANFDAYPRDRILARTLTNEKRLLVQELRTGILVRSTSYVGNIILGNLRITVTPKIAYDVLPVLFRYAYNLHHKDIFDGGSSSLDSSSFVELLVMQLAFEVEQLLHGGIHRAYRPIAEALATPRGRIDLQTIAAHGGIHEPRLPCHHFLRMEDHVLNRVLLAGLLFGVYLTDNLLLRARLRRLAALLDLSVTRVDLTAALLHSADKAVTRLSTAYSPAIDLISLLYDCTGLVQPGSTERRMSLPGFLFDMNIFFQKLVGRFLADHLENTEVRFEDRLMDMMRYAEEHNPLHRRNPVLKPDLLVFKDDMPVALLDAKYRDLWQRELPPEWLYQLTIYALSQPRKHVAIILYPTTASDSIDQVIEVCDPVRPELMARVVMRPIHLPSMARLIQDSGIANMRRLTQFAQNLIEC